VEKIWGCFVVCLYQFSITCYCFWQLGQVCLFQQTPSYQVGTSNLTPKDIPGLIRHNLHANKFCSKTALRIGDVARSSRPQKILDLLRNNDSELTSGRVLAKIG
jgi:hypothetical protein